MKNNDKRASAVIELAEEPIKTQDLTTEIATVARDFTISAYGGVLNPQDPTLATRGGAEGYRLYDDIERDCHAYAVLQKRKDAIISREYQVVPASDDPKDAEPAAFIQSVLKKIPFDQICRDLLDAVLKGFAVVELLWESTELGLIPTKAISKNQRRFVFDTDRNLRLRTLDQFYQGIPLPPRKFLVHQFGSKDGDPYGLGLGTRLFWPVWFKRQGITFWLQFVDKFASPTVKGTYPRGAGKSEKALLLEACEAVSSRAGITIPEGMMMEFMEAARTGSIQTYEGLCRYMDEQISEATLGETGTTNQSGTGGSNARDEVGNECRLEIAKSDSDAESEYLNASLIRWTVEVNFPGANPPGVWRVFEKPKDLNSLADRDNKLSNRVSFRKKYYQKTYGFEEDDFDLVEPGQASIGMPAFSEPGRADLVDTMTGNLTKTVDPIMMGMIGKVRALLAQSKTIEEFRDKLVDLYSQMDGKKLTQVVQQALMTSEMVGRAEVQSGK
jgi:phage gp29-like protein